MTHDATPGAAGGRRRRGRRRRYDDALRPGGRVPAAAPAIGRTPDVRTDDPWAEAGRKILHFHLARMLARVPGVIAGEDPEEVHAMRVAAPPDARRVAGLRRRVRARGATALSRRAARRRGRLGAVRDLDVLIEIVVAYGKQRSARQRTGLEPLLAAWRAEREARRVELVEALELGALRRVRQRLRGVRRDPRARRAPDRARTPPGLVRHRMPATIWDAYQAVWAFDDDLGGGRPGHAARAPDRGQVAALHARVRPGAARAGGDGAHQAGRGAPGPPRRPARPPCRRRCAPGSSRRPRTPTDAQGKAIGKLVDHLDQGVERLRRTFEPTWRPIVAASYRRGLGRAIARL